MHWQYVKSGFERERHPLLSPHHQIDSKPVIHSTSMILSPVNDRARNQNTQQNQRWMKLSAEVVSGETAEVLKGGLLDKAAGGHGGTRFLMAW